MDSGKFIFYWAEAQAFTFYVAGGQIQTNQAVKLIQDADESADD